MSTKTASVGLRVFQDMVSATLPYIGRDVGLPLDVGLSLVRLDDGCRVVVGRSDGFVVKYSPILLCNHVGFYEHIKRCLWDYLTGLTAGAGI